MIKATIANLPSGVSCYRDGGGWRIRLGKKFTGGPVQKRRFDTIKEAKAWLLGEGQSRKPNVPPVILQQKEGGRSSFALTPKQITEAAAAVKTLGDAGTLTEAVRFFLKHARPAGGERTVQLAADAYLKTKINSGKSAGHIKVLKSNFGKFCKDFGSDLIHLINREAVEEWIEELDVSLTTKGNHIRDLKSLFEDAVRRQWAVTNPIANLERPEAVDAKIQILQPEQVGQLLQTAQENYPHSLPLLALKIFGGLRTSELLLLRWEEIDETEIYISAQNAKTRKQRFVTLNDTLAGWLNPHRQAAGPIYEGNQNQYHYLIESVATAAKVVIPPNAFRHSFGTYHLAQHKNENLTAAEMGNSPAIVFKHYRASMRRAQADKFWQILPKESSKIIQMIA